MNRTSAILTLMIPAAPRPCMARAATSVVKLGESAQASEESVKSASPGQYTRR